MFVVNDYVPLPWQEKVHTGNWRWACLVGGKGSAKTRCAIEELKACAMEFPGTTYLIARKTLPSLKDTTWKEFIQVLPQELIKSENKADRVVTLINGSQFLGRSLDEPKKFESLKISGFLIDEADETEKAYFDTLKTRVREIIHDKKTGKKIVPRYRGILALNPTDEDHWIPHLFMVEKPAQHQMFISSTLENLDNLPPDYVETLRATYTPDMQQRMIYGHFGRVHKGRPVFPEFSRGTFIRSFEHEKKSIIFRGWDFGFRRPACVWLQFIDGQARVLAECLGRDIYLDDFVKKQVLPLQHELFPEHPIFGDWCDPHGSDESDKGKSSVEILNDHGIYPKYRRTKILEGVKAMRELMNTKGPSGEANFLIHGRCKNLIEGFRGGYHREDGEEDPAKDGFYDHLMDALRYACVNLQKRHRFNTLSLQISEQRGVYVHPITGRRIEI